MKKYLPKIKRHHIHIAVDTGDFILTAATVFLAFTMVFAGYGGYFNPQQLPAAALAAMMFPILVVVSLAALVALLIMRRRLVWVTLVSFILSIPPLLVYCPLNFGHEPVGEEAARSFKVMTYNALGWCDYTHNSLDTVAPNRTVKVVLDADPDILCLQECGSVTLHTRGVTRELLDTFFRRYPYVERMPKTSLTVYSKFPVTRFVGGDTLSKSADYFCCRLNVRGRLLTLYDTHLQSIGLSHEDKALYREITDGKTEAREISRVRDNIFSKLYDAFRQRTSQTSIIRKLIDERGGNVIVCGDFNDIPGCYAVRNLMGDDMHDAFADAGTGPSITYRAGRFYFRIDHTLYRGDFHAVNSVRIRDGLSDHYPVMTTFVWDEPSIVETDKMRENQPKVTP